MFTYMNKITGAVVQTHGKVSGSNWELVKDKPKGKEKEKDGE